VITTEAVSSWLRQIRSEPDPVLAEMEAHGARDGIPIVDPQGGQLLQVLALARGARRIVEVGTAIGVSTLYMARALPSNGELISFDIDPERQGDASEYLDRAGVGDRVDLRLQDAREGLRELDGPFDMAFIDGVKAQYPDYYELLIELLGPGAVLAVDNVLMSGTVAEGRSDGHWSDEQIAGQRAFISKLLADERLTTTVTPVGDGVLVAVVR
jgi:predicted O-methyltransferase YrrM